MATHWDQWITRWAPASPHYPDPDHVTDLTPTLMILLLLILPFTLRITLLLLALLLLILLPREDLETLSNSGINHIRIPVGYWTWQVAELSFLNFIFPGES